MPDNDRALKRLACQLASQLPEETEEALRVLDYTRSIISALDLGAKSPPHPPPKLRSVPLAR